MRKILELCLDAINYHVNNMYIDVVLLWIVISHINYSSFNLISRLTAEVLYKQLQLLDRLITHHHPFSRTIQLENLYLPKSKEKDESLRNKRDDDIEELQEEHNPYLFGNPILQVRL